MSDLRFDPVSGLWTLIAPHRDHRPVELLPVEKVRKRSICPFCGGNESETPTALAVYDSQGVARTDGHSDNTWLSRVVPNKYASFGKLDAGSNGHVSSACDHHGPFLASSLHGPQELVIPTPRHVSSLSELDGHETRTLWHAAQDRINSMRADGLARHAMLFMNCRSQAGASLEHVHVQLMGSPVVTDYLAARVQRNRDSLQRENKTLVEAVLAWELGEDKRIVTQSDNFTVLCPFASRFAYQTWIVPNRRDVSFMQLDARQRDELGLLCRSLTGCLEDHLHNPAYNMLLQIAPFENSADDHWYVEILPRTTRSAGFELGTDVWVNPMPPELAAEQLKVAQQEFTTG